MTTTNHVPNVKRWDACPDRESLRVIYRFLNQREEIENVSLEPYRTHPRLVRATVTDRVSSTQLGILEIRWYETTDFIITYQPKQTNNTSPLLRWTSSPDAEGVVVSHRESDVMKMLRLPSHHLIKNRVHPLRVVPFVLASIK